MIAAAHTVRNVTAAEIKHFHQYGFVRLRALITPKHITRIRIGIDSAQASSAPNDSSIDLTQFAETARTYASEGRCKSGQRTEDPFNPVALGEAFRKRGVRLFPDPGPRHKAHGRWLVDRNPSRHIPELSEFARNSELPYIAARLLNADAVRLYNDILCTKEANMPMRSAFHQDLSHLHIGGDKGCTFWLFIDPVREGSGAIGCVPGSHKWGQIFKPNFLVSDVALPGSEGAELPEIDTAPEAFGVQYIEADPGDVIVHHFLTLRCRQGNRSNQVSRVFGSRYVDANTRFRRRSGITPPMETRQAAREGAALDNALHPIVWSEAKLSA